MKPNPGQDKAITLAADAAKRLLMFYGGSRSGKTYLIVYLIFCRAIKAPGSRHVMLRKHFLHARQSLGMDTIPKVISNEFRGCGIVCNKSDWYWTLPNGAEVWIGGLDDGPRVEKILGKEYATLYFNEVSQIDYDSFCLARTRLAQRTSLRNVIYLDQNPSSTAHWSYKMVVRGLEPVDNVPLPADIVDTFGVMKINPQENLENIDPEYIKTLESMPRAQRQRFLLGDFSAGVEGALWKIEWISDNRLNIDPKKLSNPDRDEDGMVIPGQPVAGRIVVGVDPAVTSKKGSDHTGIVVAAEDIENECFYILEDLSMKGTPKQWAEVVCDAYKRWNADLVVAEVNNGGDLVETVIRGVDQTISYKAVRASRGKHIRAEPISSLYEQGKVRHIGEFPDLESEYTTWLPSEQDSPDRLDAAVWALTELSGEGTVSVWQW